MYQCTGDVYNESVCMCRGRGHCCEPKIRNKVYFKKKKKISKERSFRKGSVTHYHLGKRHMPNVLQNII